MLNAGQLMLIKFFFPLFHTFNKTQCMGQFECFPSDMEKQEKATDLQIEIICYFLIQNWQGNS